MMTDINIPEIQENADRSDNQRLPWSTPKLRLYDASALTKGSSDQSSDGFINTHS
ncbi:MAG: hypothetical protein KBB36_02115 [Ferrovibrio sp.]|nr:hypothetical protein [Ferrovibrio sp.]